MTRQLTLWLRGERLAEVEQLRTGRLRLRFDTDALDRYGLGARPLSLSLPLTERRVEGDLLERFLDNLLPEGAVRAAIERQHGIWPGDTFALLARIGEECAGAVQLTPADAPPGDGELVPLDAVTVDRVVSSLPTLDPPEGQVVSASLGGVQSKVLLSRTSHGWAWPSRGAMSTHLVKPEPVTDLGVPDLIRWEGWALRLARTAGIPAAQAEIADFDGRLALVVQRFDRSEGRRTHQEDFTQALGIAARDKYESSAEDARLQRIARDAGAEARSPARFARDLLAQVAFNLVIGNGDAHSKNYSLTIDETATFAMAPLYDVAPVYLLNARYENFGHALDGQVRLRHLTADHLLREAAGWGLPDEAAREVLARVASRVRSALPGTDTEGMDVGPLAEVVDARARAMLEVAEAG